MITAHHLLLCGVSASALMSGGVAPEPLGPPINAILYATSTKSVTTSWTLVPTHAVAYDWLGVSSGGAGKITIPSTLNGKRVRLFASIECDGNFTMEIRKNGSAFPGTGSSLVYSAGDSKTHASTGLVSVSTGDYFEIYAKSLSGSISTIAASVWIAIEVMGDDFSGAMVSASGNVTSNTTTRDIAFGVEEFDIGDWYDSSLNPDRFVVPADVDLIRLSGGCMWPSTGEQVLLSVWKNGLGDFDGAPALDTESGPSASPALSLSSGPIAVAEGDELSLTTYSADTLTVVPSNYRWMAVEKLPSGLRYAMLRKSTTQNVNAGTNTRITWDNVIADVADMYSGDNPSRLTVPGGVRKVRISAGIYRSSEAGQSVMKLYKNGAPDIPGLSGFENDTSGQDFLHLSTPILDVSPGDYFEINSYFTYGSVIQTGANTYFSMEAVEVPASVLAIGLTIPSSSVTSTLTNFPVRLDLSDMPSEFWVDVESGGGNVRIKDSEGELLPLDVVWIDALSQRGEIFFKAPSLSSSADNEFTIELDASSVALEHSDPIGRHAVWSDYDAVFMFSELEDRSGNGRDATTVGTVPNNAYVPATYSGDMGSAHQGVAWDGTYYYVIDTTQVRKHNWSGTQIGSAFNLVDTGTADVNHFGDGTFHDGKLYVVYETYPNNPYDNQHVVVIDPDTMTMITSYDISAQGHEVSSITYEPVNGYFVITDYTVSGASVLHKYDDSFNYLGTIPCSPISNKQGIAYYGNAFWITCAAKELYKMPLDGSSKTLMWSGGLGNYVEGIAAKDNGDLLILIDYTLQSYIYRFAPGSAVGEPGWLNLDGSGHAVGHDMPTRTQWTMGASVVLLRNNNGRSLLSYSPEVTSNNFRATLAVRSSPNNWGIWNSTDTWLTTSAVAPTIGVRRRLHHTQNGTTNRKLWIDGVLRTTDTGTVQRPATSGETMGLFIGAEDTSASERMFASINYVYLRNGELSADWIAAEQKSWETDTFYTVTGVL